VPREPSALPGAWPPVQTLALPPRAALGPLSPCQGAPGARAAHPDRDTSLICHLSSGDSETLQNMLEHHECPLKNEHVLRRAPGQRPEARTGCAELCMPSPGLAG
jgi:hypothetical protein